MLVGSLKLRQGKADEIPGRYTGVELRG